MRVSVVLLGWTLDFTLQPTGEDAEPSEAAPVTLSAQTEVFGFHPDPVFPQIDYEEEDLA